MTLRRKSTIAAAVLGILASTAWACRSGAPPVDAPPRAEDRETPPPAAASTPAKESEPPRREEAAPETVPATARGPSSTTTATAPAPPATAPGPPTTAAGSFDDRILPATRRTADGLPDPVAGYTSWFGIARATSEPEGTSSAHLPARKTYILPSQDLPPAGKPLTTPVHAGTIVVLEEKAPGKDFISRINVMMREEAGWKYLEYARDASDKAFLNATGSEADCAACHAKAANDSLYSPLIFEG